MQIKEFLPNPVGSDKEGEYIKILNDGNTSVLLDGWKLKDASGKIFNLSGNLESGLALTLPYSETKISLNNNGEQIFLYDDTGKLVDELSYSGQASEGQIINKSQMTGNQTTDDNMVLNNTLAISEPITNYQFLITNNFFFINFLIAVILAGLGLYIVLQLEKRLDTKLF
ncbi:MAG: lamin tail domain-containing protein [Candidatus Harrisonbacteria bacterium]|nr:lamin tail domain-containing protein [Candidatus Harrisonbacteria bacterium]